MKENGSNTTRQMKRLSLKVAAVVVTLLIVITMTVSVSYAWITLSKSPVVSGAQVVIAGGTTILLAPDLVGNAEVNGETVSVHYPGTFTDHLDISSYASYGYLGDLAGISPVSTSDGIHWIIPTYSYSTGGLNPYSAFEVDETLQYANRTEASSANYIYLDFWVVSPGSEYKLRVSMDTKSKEGSSLAELPGVVRDDSTLSGYALEELNGLAASVARVGFLVNESHAQEEDMLTYMRSADYDSRYQKLKGVYQEPGVYSDPNAANRFTIYEPNGTLHVNPELTGGEYVITSPLRYDESTGEIRETDVRSILTVQNRSYWKLTENERLIDQMFQTGVSGVNIESPEDAFSRFYDRYLQWQLQPYLTAGSFFQRTATLYELAVNNRVSAEMVAESVSVAGATDDVYITMLERNTPQRIRMFIWLEGQDPDCRTLTAESRNFVLNLELAGAN